MTAAINLLNIYVAHRNMNIFVFQTFSLGIICISILIPLLNEISDNYLLKSVYRILNYFILDNNKKVVIDRLMHSTFPIFTHYSGLMFTPESLKLYDGSSREIYLAILGRVYNVTKGIQHYGISCTYNYFAGRDGTRAFATGNSDDAIENLDGLTYDQVLDIISWITFYESDYFFLGLVSGLFYDFSGQPSNYLLQFNKSYTVAVKKKQKEDKDKKMFPSCNSEWTPEKGSRFWCSKQSGGIKRNWEGLPRKLFQPASHVWRCICLNPSMKLTNRIQSHLKEFSGCSSESLSCLNDE